MILYVNMKHNNVTVLGPHKRYGLWVSGCNRNCPGCISPESHDMKKGTPFDTGELAWDIIPSEAEGMTISGGEPFLQAEALTELIKKVKKHRDIGIIIYSGFLYEEIIADEKMKKLLKLCDLLIDGPYISELDDNKSLRGSSNQRVIKLSDRYEDYLYMYGTGERQTQQIIKPTRGIFDIGIPTDSKY